MKKNILYLFLLFSFCSKGETHIITVSNFQFSPSNLNVLVGDVIRWEWAEGFHNTASLTIPAGALPWTAPVSGAGFSYEYTVATAGTYNYQCDPHAGFMLGSFTASGVLPIKLSSFVVAKQSSKPYLSWTTQLESNSSHFVVRRSYDGEIFREIGRVPAAGHSTILKNYSFLDTEVKNNCRFVYYELVITDADGKYQLSPIRLLKNNESVTRMVTSISPNPVSSAGHLMIQFNADDKTMMRAIFTDVNGRQVMVTQLSASPGINNGHIPLDDLAPGAYIMRFSMGGKTETHKIIKR